MVTASFRTIMTATVSLAACLATACTTMRPVTLDARAESALHAGDEVRVLTKSGATHDFKLTAVGADSLSGTAVAVWGTNPDPVGTRIDVPYADIAHLEVRRASALKTTGLVAAAAVIAIVIASGGGSHEAGYGSR